MTNGKVAPHLNCEVRLVQAGTKPLAVIERNKDPMGFSLANSLSIVGSVASMYRFDKDGNAEIIITKPHQQFLIGEYLDLINNGVDKYGLKEYHRRMGRLFGYSEEDIEKFITANIQCNCDKCRGKAA